MAQSIQHDPAALILELSAASTPNIHSLIASPRSQLPDAIVSMPLVQNIRQVNCPVCAESPPCFSWKISLFPGFGGKVRLALVTTTIRAILLASAMAATFVGRRANNAPGYNMITGLADDAIQYLKQLYAAARQTVLPILRSRREPRAASTNPGMDRQVQRQVRHGSERIARANLLQPEEAWGDPGEQRLRHGRTVSPSTVVQGCPNGARSAKSHV
jgi:hypothetical protein